MSLGLILGGIIIIIAGVYEVLVSLLLCDVIDNIKVQIRSLLSVLGIGVGFGLLIAGIIMGLIV